MFRHSIREIHAMQGKRKPVTPWFAHHASVNGWIEGIDYEVVLGRSTSGRYVTDWRLTDKAASSMKVKGFVYVMKVGNEYKVGRTRNPKQRVRDIGGEWMDLVMCSNATDLEHKAHKAFKAFSTHEEYYNDKLPIDELWHFLRMHAIR